MPRLVSDETFEAVIDTVEELEDMGVSVTSDDIAYHVEIGLSCARAALLQGFELGCLAREEAFEGRVRRWVWRLA